MGTRINTPQRIAYSINEAAVSLGISRSTVYGLLRTGQLHAVQIGARKRVPAEEIARLLEPQMVAAATSANPQASLPTVTSTATASPTPVVPISAAQRQSRVGHSKCVSLDDSGSHACPPVAPAEKPRAPSGSPPRAKLSELMALVREPSASR